MMTTNDCSVNSNNDDDHNEDDDGDDDDFRGEKRHILQRLWLNYKQENCN